MQRLEAEPAHVLQVTALALRLFDELTPLHGLGAPDRLLLEAATCLHDIGWSVVRDGKGHHKESARLIREHPWEHWPRVEVELMAMIARYHRKSKPSREHAVFAALGDLQRHRVEQLAAILRMADGMDRSHQARVKSLTVTVMPQSICLILGSDRNLLAETEAVQKKGDLAQLLWQRTLVVEVRKLPAAG
jgi:exopolyphosphatase/guanosine-5'-triphosphate,3'-diphosphate pyrophosphatase